MQVKCKIGVKLVSSKVRPIGTGGRVSDRLPHIGCPIRDNFTRHTLSHSPFRGRNTPSNLKRQSSERVRRK